MSIMHDEHIIVLENHNQFVSMRELMFLIWELGVIDNATGNYVLDEVDWMRGHEQRLQHKADKCL